MAEDQGKKPYDGPETKQLAKFNMYTPAPGVEGKRSSLIWGVRDGNPRITVFTNVPNGKGNNDVLYAGIAPEEFFIFLNEFEKICNGPNNQKQKMECYGGKEKVLISNLVYGKDENGICWISLTAEGKPRIQFQFTISDYHKFIKSDGQSLSPSEASVAKALGAISAIRRIYTTFASEFAQPFNGRQSNGNQTSTSSRPVQELPEDDILF